MFSAGPSPNTKKLFFRLSIWDDGLFNTKNCNIPSRVFSVKCYFIASIYILTFIIIFSFNGPSTGAGRVLWICVCPSFRPSVLLSFHLEVFSGLAHQFFSEIQHGVRGPGVVVHDRPRFFEKKKKKNPFAQNMVKMDQK